MKNNVLLVILLFLGTSLLAQNRQLDKANDLYKMERYAEAIPIYEKLLEKKESLAWQTKLAYCYRINNKMQEAEALYAKIVKHERAKDITYFYYGETLIANEKYKEAKYWFNQYKKMEQDDDRVALMLRACDEVQEIQPFFSRLKVTEFPYNSDADDSSPVFFNNGIVFSSDRKQGIKLLKQKSGWTGRDYLRLYYSEASTDTSLYAAPKTFSSKLNELNKNMGNPSFTADGSFVFYTKNNNELSRKNAYSLQLYQAEAVDGRWKNIEKLSFCSPEYNFMHPAVSPDGKYLFFVSDKARGKGGTDIYVSKKKGDGWGKPQNLGENINTAYHEGFPFLHKNGKLYFCSKGHVGYGGFDVFVSEMDDQGEWQKPINLGKPINSPLDDISVFLNEDETEGMFTSARDGGDDDIYLFRVGEGTDYRALAVNTTAKIKKEQENTARDLGQLPMEYEQIERPKEEAKRVENEEEFVTDLIENMPDEQKTKVEIESPVLNDGFIEKIENKDLVEVPVEKEVEEPVIETNIPVEKAMDQVLEVAIPAKEVEITEIPTTSKKVEKVEVKEEIRPTTPIVTENIPVQEEIPVAKKVETTTDLSIEKKSTPIELEKKEAEETIAKPPVRKVTENLERLFYLLQNDKAEVDDMFRLTNLQFDKGQFKVTPAIAKRLDEVAALLSTFPNLQIELLAHTSSVGSADKNLSLAQVRAASAKVYLVRNGVEGERIVTKGYGESQLLNHCVDGVYCSDFEHRKNQRLLIRVIGL